MFLFKAILEQDKLYYLSELFDIKESIYYKMNNSYVNYNNNLNRSYHDYSITDNFKIIDDFGSYSSMNSFLKDEQKVVLKFAEKTFTVYTENSLPNIEYHILFNSDDEKNNDDIFIKKFFHACYILNNYCKNLKKYSCFLIKNNEEDSPDDEHDDSSCSSIQAISDDIPDYVSDDDSYFPEQKGGSELKKEDSIQEFDAVVYHNELDDTYILMKKNLSIYKEENSFVFQPQATITCKLEHFSTIINQYLKETPNYFIFIKIVELANNILYNFNNNIKQDTYKIIVNLNKYFVNSNIVNKAEKIEKIRKSIKSVSDYEKIIQNFNDYHDNKLFYDTLINKINHQERFKNWLIILLFEIHIIREGESFDFEAFDHIYYKNISPFILRHYIHDLYPLNGDDNILKIQHSHFQNFLYKEKMEKKRTIFKNSIEIKINLEHDYYIDIMNKIISSDGKDKTEILMLENKKIKSYTTLFPYNDFIIYIELRNFSVLLKTYIYNHKLNLGKFNLTNLKKYSDYYEKYFMTK
jgi:hypothetical protein